MASRSQAEINRVRRDLTALNVRGEIKLYAGPTAPTGWLLCDGAAISRTDYGPLFALISTAFGVGDGSTTFNVPDFRGRVPIMIDGAADRITAASVNGGNADAMGGAGGAQTHTLIVSEMPAHTHTQIGDNDSPGASGGGLRAGHSGSTTGIPTVSTGGDGAHSNTPPWLAVNFIIKY